MTVSCLLLCVCVCVCVCVQVSRILYSFATAFRRSAKKPVLSAQAPPLTPDSDVFTFTVSLEIKEDDGKGTFRYGTSHVTAGRANQMKAPWLLLNSLC